MAEHTVVRVRTERLATFLAVLPDAKQVRMPSSEHGGCSDPECCAQHSGVVVVLTPDGGSRRTTLTGLQLPPGMSGSAFHRVKVSLFGKD